MEMQEADGRCVRIVTECGEAFDGDCSFCPGEYCMAEIGREEDALEIDNCGRAARCIVCGWFRTPWRESKAGKNGSN